ncbi:cyanophycin synthetase [Bdellovibrio sp. HCB2-146]|uniref:cyanophycin synthetase n=1 Tax=Bdellovibrio sp. HCB2-146 TaxID=3394362 RepID=UPI0039BC933A
MKISRIKAIYGPNVYHSLPVLVTRLHLEEWTDIASNQIEGFTDNLIALLPGLDEHHCSPQKQGGFVERLRRGTYFAHIIEHVSLELSSLSGIRVNYGKSRYAGAPGVYDIITCFQSEEGMQGCVELAVNVVLGVLSNKPVDLATEIEKIKKIVANNEMGPTTEALYRAARKRNIPIRRIGNQSVYQLGYGKYIRKIQTAISSKTSLIAAEMVQDKDLTKRILAEHFIDVPEGFVISDEAAIPGILQKLRPPLVVKPLDGNHGNGVTLQLETEWQVLEAFRHASQFSKNILIEEYCPGLDYRVLIVDGRFLAAAERMPPSVMGHDNLTILQLIEELNQDPRRGDGHSSVLSKVKIDVGVLEKLGRQGFTPDSVPHEGQLVYLRGNANISGGGTAKDVTELVHKDVKSLCEKISRVMDLDICGIDLIHSDISKPPHEGMRVIEVNAGPGIRMHVSPSEGDSQDVDDKIISYMFPENKPVRIPIVALTGTNGKTTVARMLYKIFSQDACGGLTSTDGVWVGDQQVAWGDTSGPSSAWSVLADPKVEFAILELARGGLLRGGLAYEESDVGIITNIREDHLGQDGIEDLDDLVWIKSLVAEGVKENGTLVINADDEGALRVLERPQVQRIPRKLVLFSIFEDNPLVKDHLRNFGKAIWIKGDWIFLGEGSVKTRLCRVQDIPITMQGRALFQVSNTLAAIGGAYGAGLNMMKIINGLKAFKMSDNPGRMNLFRVNQGTVILDYGHNSDAIESIGQFVNSMKTGRKTAVLGLPGDRHLELIENSAKITSVFFDRVVIREDDDLRGRPAGEISGIIQKAIQEENRSVETRVVLDACEAFKLALQEMKPQEVVVVFYEKMEPMMQVLSEYNPIPMEIVPEFLPEFITHHRHFDGVERRVEMR